MKRALLSLGLPALPALLACGGGTDGTQPVTPVPPAGRLAIVLNFCLQDNIYAGERGVPTFFAYRNDGEVWTPLSPDANGSFAFTAAPKVAITFVQGNQTQTYYTSAQAVLADDDMGWSPGNATRRTRLRWLW